MQVNTVVHLDFSFPTVSKLSYTCVAGLLTLIVDKYQGNVTNKAVLGVFVDFITLFVQVIFSILNIVMDIGLISYSKKFWYTI